ncbi:LOW QUALITY PROTEIN: protein RIC-3 [Micropterus dolomieu]|uniref:LOW QUALITY PROTEIN: protein RIC-3 n=1 Tax=Micropterus dolomieu TaxID=147949 RepID=UPI001E8E49E5|nr:LOW QUALITY PROTEIN: protein RIC-3 [Micropterus dolomieu]
MLLPRGKKEMGQPEVGPGFYPPVMNQLSLPVDPERWGVDPSYSMTHSAEAMAKIKGIGRGKKYNLMAQAIPIYGFGIFLYIFYIIYKLTCKGKTTKSGNHTTVTKANVESKIITEYEFAMLQERLLQTEKMMERIVSAKSRGSGSGRRRKSKTTTSKKEEKLLRQLRQITQLMQESRLEGASPEMEAEEVPYSADWEGYPEETYPVYDESYDRPRFDSIILEVPLNQPTAEALAERMEQEEEEIMARKLSIVQEEEEEEEEEAGDRGEEEDKEKEVEEVEEDTEEEEEEEEEEGGEEEEEEEEEEEAEKRLLLSLPLSQPAMDRKQERLGLEVSKELQCHNGGKKQISFCDHRDVFHYPKEDTCEEEGDEKEDEVEEDDEGTEAEEEDEGDEDDPVMEAESLQFSCEGCPNPEEEAEEGDEEHLSMSVPAGGDGRIVTKEVGVSGLRMRNRRET